MHKRFGVDVNLEYEKKWAHEHKKMWFESLYLYLSQNERKKWWVLRAKNELFCSVAENAGCIKCMCAGDRVASHRTQCKLTPSRLAGMSDKRSAVYVYTLSHPKMRCDSMHTNFDSHSSFGCWWKFSVRLLACKWKNESFVFILSLSLPQSLVTACLLRERCFCCSVNLIISPAAKSIKHLPIFELYVWLSFPFVSAWINQTHTCTCADSDWVRRFVSMRSSAKSHLFIFFVFPWNQIFIFPFFFFS